MNSKTILKDCLNVWWYRPENALVIASYCVNGISFNKFNLKNSADFACGDGVNTFLKCGGSFDSEFDIFGHLTPSLSHKEIVKQKIDIFDLPDSKFKPLIKKRPKIKFSFGTDHKKVLLDKAKKLNFYNNLFLSDLNVNEKKIEDESLDFLYCNSLYWVNNSTKAFNLMLRKVKKNGYLVFDVMTQNRRFLNYENLFPQMPKQWGEFLNRGRQNNNPGIKSIKEWDKLFNKKGAHIIEQKNDILPTSIAYLWNVGLRPIFPIISKMANSLNKKNRKDLKKEWVETFFDLLHPILENPDALIKRKQSIRLQYVIKKII